MQNAYFRITIFRSYLIYKNIEKIHHGGSDGRRWCYQGDNQDLPLQDVREDCAGEIRPISSSSKSGIKHCYWVGWISPSFLSTL